MRLRVYLDQFRCEDAPHVVGSPFYVSVCLPRLRIMWRRRKR